MAALRTLAQAIEDAAKAEPTRGFRFVPDTGVPGSGATGEAADADLSETSYSYSAIERASGRYGAGLAAMGLAKGDRVALIIPNNDDFIFCFLGAMRVGVIPVPIYPPLGVGQLETYLENTRHIVRKSGAKAIVTTPKIKRVLGTVQRECPDVREVASTVDLRDSNAPFAPAKVSLDDTAFLQFTSGSTSRPKGVQLTHRNLAENIRCIMEHGLRITPEDVGISWLPLYHDMGLIGFVLAPLMHTIPIVYLSPLLFLKRPVSWFQAFSRHRGSIAYAPNFAYALCVKRIREADTEGLDLSTWRVAGCGAEPIRAETLDAFAEKFAPIGFPKSALLPSYGMAESSLAVAFSGLGSGVSTYEVGVNDLWEKRVAEPPKAGDGLPLVSCGPAFPEHTISVFDAADGKSERALREGVVGEIRIKGPSVMPGYWEDPELTSAAFKGDYLATGDLGFLRGGELYVCGRSKEVIIINGRNYYPQDIEWEVAKVKGVRKGNVVAFGSKGKPGVHGDREQVVVAFEVQDAATLAAAAQPIADIRKSVQDGVALTVDDVVPLAPGSLPKTSSGKLQRAKTKELYERGELVSVTKKGRRTQQLEVIKHAVASQLSYLGVAIRRRFFSARSQ